MYTIGLKFNGRFGNQLFEYAFMRIYAKEQGLILHTDGWHGQSLFGCDEPPLDISLPFVKDNFIDWTPETCMVLRQKPRNCNVEGYWAFHTKWFAQWKDFVISLFQPVNVPDVFLKSKTLVSIHMRVAEDIALWSKRCGHDAEGQRYMRYLTPTSWYLDWLASIWKGLDDPILHVATDTPGTENAFIAADYPVVTTNIDSEYEDFCLMTQADYLAISCSSYSFFASMLNQKAKTFMRPCRYHKCLVPFDPWDAEPLPR